MNLSRKQTIAILLPAILFFAFTLLHASWLAPKPMGRPKLVADHAVEPVRDAAGCIASANTGYGGAAVSPDVAALQGAAGARADAIRVTTEMVDGKLVLARQFESKCAADRALPRAMIAEAAAAISKPELFWQVESEAAARQLVANLPGPEVDVPDRNIIIGDREAIKFIRTLRPGYPAFSVSTARACAADYRASLLGSVPESCRNGTMLLTLDDLGFTLWGWPNRFFERMRAANVRLIIAQDVVDGRIKGLTEPGQYGEIAEGYGGYIWADDIEELGPALRR